MRDKYDYMRVLLYAYPHAEKLSEAVRVGAKVRASLSFKHPMDTLAIMESIAADMAHAECLLRWKEQLERAISYCSEEELFLLEYKYFRRKSRLSGRTITCSERSYFRKQKQLLSRLCCRMQRRGCTEEAFLRDFEGFSPYMTILKALMNGWERKLVQRRSGRPLFGGQSSSSEGAGFLPRSTKKTIAESAAMPTMSAAMPMGESAAEGSGAGSSGTGATVSAR